MFQFTRFLYEKEEVELSLLICLLQKKESALFWGYELYYSGFQEDLINLIWKIYYYFYAALNLSFESYLAINLKDLNEDKLARVLINLTYRKWTRDVFILKNICTINNYNLNKSLEKKKYMDVGGNILYKNNTKTLSRLCDYFKRDFDKEQLKYKKSISIQNGITSEIKLLVYFINYLAVDTNYELGKNLFIQVNNEDYNKYGNIYVNLNQRGNSSKYPLLPILASREILEKGRQESIEKSINLFYLKRDKMNLNDACWNHWEYYAFNTPIWNKRITDLSGVQDEVKKTIIFPDDNIDGFYDNYGYEPDEQPRFVHDKSNIQLDIQDWYAFYNDNSIVNFKKDVFNNINKLAF
jgi:hypothetical protein